MNDLKAFLDGELDAAASATMQGRLQSDATVAATADGFRRISASFGALTDGPAVTGRERALAAVAAPRATGLGLKLAGAIAGVVLVGLIALEVFPEFSRAEMAATGSVAAPAGEASLESAEPPGRKGIAGADSEVSNAPATAAPMLEGDMMIQRQVVKTARMAVRVQSVESAEAEVTKWVEQAQGYVGNTTSSNLNGTTPSMTLTLRVPQARFTEALTAFEKLGTRISKDTQSSDVTQEIVDMNARLKNLRAQEETYRSILRSAKKIGEIIDVQQRLSAIRGDIESMQAQRDTMAKLAALSTIDLTLTQRPPAEEAVGGGWVEDTWSNATFALASAFRGLSVIGIWVLVYAPLWIPVGLLTLWGWRRALRA